VRFFCGGWGGPDWRERRWQCVLPASSQSRDMEHGRCQASGDSSGQCCAAGSVGPPTLHLQPGQVRSLLYLWIRSELARACLNSHGSTCNARVATWLDCDVRCMRRLQDHSRGARGIDVCEPRPHWSRQSVAFRFAGFPLAQSMLLFPKSAHVSLNLDPIVKTCILPLRNHRHDCYFLPWLQRLDNA